MSSKFTVTYEIVTPESAEDGEAAETGFVLPGDWHITIAEALADTEGTYTMSLRDALYLADPDYDCGRWFTERCGRENYRTGARETRSIHPPANITNASYRRVARILGV